MRMLWSVLLFKVGLKTFSVESLYRAFLKGEIPADGIHALLKIEQVKDFISLHERVKKSLKEGDREIADLPLEVMLAFLSVLENDRRKLHFAIAQVDGIIRRDLEKGILRRKGKGNVVRREE